MKAILLLNSLIGIFWLIFIAYWIFAATQSKKTLNTKTWRWGIAIRLILFVIVVVFLQSSSAGELFAYRTGGALGNPIAAVIGTILCAAGIAFAIWARVYLGRNWGMPMSVKENPELVTSGPYARVRHPIYTGMLFAMFGSALAGDAIWFFVFVIFGGYFIFAATREERLMLRQFPDEYPAYKKRTKMLIPFVL